MYYFSNELHSKHRVLGLDADDIPMLMIVYSLALYVSFSTLWITVPLFIVYYKTKQQRSRGFLRHLLYSVQMDNVSMYPSAKTLYFKQ
ncbi:type IV conjugative transfer system protein TraL [Bathymodiolus heckerae thiotrophic gill symbiont]|uniref:type IV conjugative transfer system protein TraL n=1 Tax=Bathymodiolus heckerae thiotrophic gill symbiont TaxID=1052212 RepID=UPI0010FEA8FA|nr:type IV conjugative transfer system protein TraL [Bathymodiolus heckerae thiotrophic gill symbiont]CAC9585936.1 hypothetical protein [uncultured Gammaproteobacteria bacterium]